MHWLIEPVWQNYSSMYREAVTASEAQTGMELAHHRMAALYFGISAIESFLNLKMRDHLLSEGKSHEEIHEVLRKGELKGKLKKWPVLILGAPLEIRADSIERVLSANALRGDLTHQKNFWPEAYRELARTDPMDLVDLVAEFIVQFHHAKGELFPYWVWGWNYLNPQADAYEIALINNTQFMHSLGYLGYKVESGSASYDFERRQGKVFAGFKGYMDVASFLRSCTACEPKVDRFPYQPKLCQRWWETSHQRACGIASEHAIRLALEIDEAYGRRASVPLERRPPMRWERLLSRIFGRSD